MQVGNHQATLNNDHFTINILESAADPWMLDQEKKLKLKFSSIYISHNA